MHQAFDFESPERFIAGTVGPPGERTFFLQAKEGELVVSVALEKLQVAVLADKLEELLNELTSRFGVTVPTNVAADNDPLDTPVDEEFRVGTLGLAWDEASTTIIVEAIEVAAEGGAEDAIDDENLNRLRVRITPATTRQFIDRARKIIAAGRPPCPLCGQPLDPSGHLCPRHNGYRR
ncbi:MAG: DUF3090 domain-containing protein [Longispora sp.]|nr:DUF3090 domain-containing protein [Longispora sp. (in: high G+C Gram-positive bacteria)]